MSDPFDPFPTDEYGDEALMFDNTEPKYLLGMLLGRDTRGDDVSKKRLGAGRVCWIETPPPFPSSIYCDCIRGRDYVEMTQSKYSCEKSQVYAGEEFSWRSSIARGIRPNLRIAQQSPR